MRRIGTVGDPQCSKREKYDPAGTQKIADELGIARQSADYRLRNLEKEGKLSVKKVGETLVWSVDR